jgi:hypothetical protein
MFFIILTLCTWFNWKTLKTHDFTVIYKDDYEWEALHTLQNLEYYKDSVQKIVGGMERMLPVVIEDVGALSNGFADPIFNNVHIFTHPPGFTYRMEGMESWYRTVAVHEYAHILHLSKTRGLSRLLSSIFGPVFAPNLISPGWMIEGITVYSESRQSAYEGRLNDGFFDTFIGARASDGAMPSITDATNTPHDFPFGTYYLYGGEIYAFLAQRYGEEKFAEFHRRYGGYFWAPLSAVFPFSGLDIAARHTYGKSFSELFREWQEYENDRYADWQPTGTRVTDQGWYVYSLLEAGGKIYYVRYEPEKVDGFVQRSMIHIMEFDPSNSNERTLAALNGTISTPLRYARGNLYYTTREFARGYANVYYGGFGLVSNLHEKNLVTGSDRVLLTDDIRAFCILSDGRILYSRDKSRGFGSELWIHEEGESVMLFGSDLLVGELEANADHVIAVARNDFENWSIYVLNLEGQELSPLIKTPWIEGSVSLVADAILFTANYGKVYSLYMYDLQTNELYRLTDKGYAEHGVVIADKLYFKGMSRHGFDIYKTEFCPKSFRYIENSHPGKPDFESMELEITEGGYFDVMKTLVPSVRVPFALPVESDLSAWTYGLFLLGGDATDENIYGGIVYRDWDEGEMVFNLLWQSRLLTPLDISLFYDYRNSLEYTISFPAFLSLEYGFSNLNLFLGGRVFDGLTRVEYAPGCAVRFKYPHTTLAASFSFPFERQAWGSDIHRSAQRMALSIQQYFYGGEYRFLGQAYVDQHNPEIPDFTIRGYDAIESRRAMVLSNEYVHRLCRLRKGLWNPNFYVEDAYWVIFADYARTGEGSIYYSVGGELRLEVKAGFGFLQLVPRLGFALTGSQGVQIFFGISPSIPI